MHGLTSSGRQGGVDNRGKSSSSGWLQGTGGLGLKQHPLGRGIKHHMNQALMTVGVGGDGQSIRHLGTTADGSIAQKEERHDSNEPVPMTPQPRSPVQRESSWFILNHAFGV
jgi:hypothetical protein